MKRKGFAGRLLTAALAATILTGCGSTSKIIEESSDEASSAESTAVEAASEDASEEKESKNDLTGEDLYEAFMKGEASVKMNIDKGHEDGNVLRDDIEDGKGEILIDDVNIKDYNLYELRKKIGLVSQEPVLFKRSILVGNYYGSTYYFLLFINGGYSYK